VWFTEVGFLPFVCSNLGTEPPLNISSFRKASTDASVRDDVFRVARFGGPGRLSCVAGHRGPVHGVPHNSLGASKGPVAAEYKRSEVLRIDGGLASSRWISQAFLYITLPVRCS
jgi:hypothetical protein